MAWARLKVLYEGSLGRDANVFAIEKTDCLNVDPMRRERAINMDHVVYWVGKGDQRVYMALANGQFLIVETTDRIMEVLTGCSPNVLGSDWDPKKRAG
ncbi:MAG: hypothetical protein JWO65_1662 [Sphingomonas bacterium]|jgi:hypothetical protein|nr:hypothetical protein [Sphingomonas bacterium]